MSYMYCASMPILFAIVGAMLTASRYLDQRNLINIMQPPPQSSEKIVTWMLKYIMPIAVLLHLVCAKVSFDDLSNEMDENTQDSWKERLKGLAQIGLAATEVVSGNLTGI